MAKYLNGGKGNPLGAGDGNKWINDTNERIIVCHGYDTVANGYADEIAVEPQEVVQRTRRGGPTSFSEWRIQSSDEISEEEEVTLRLLSSVRR